MSLEHTVATEPPRETEIGAVPKTWQVLRLGEVVRFKSGESRPQELLEAPNGDRVVPVYGGNGVMGYTSRGLLADTRLVVGRVGAYCGCVHVAPGPSWITDNALYSSQLLREVSLEFLAAQLRYKDLNRLKRKAAQPLVTQSILNKLLIVLPPLLEQRAIAKVLDALQKPNEIRQRELALERERKAALMEYLFTHGTRNEPTKQTEIGEIPESWQVTVFDEIVTTKQYGLSVRGQERGAVPILRMNNLVDGKVDATDLQRVDISAELLEAFGLEHGDLLFNRTNSQDLVGKTSLFDLDGSFVFASYLIRLRINAAHAAPAFINVYLNRENIVKRVQMLATRGVSQSNISASKLGRFPVPVPSLEEQREIAVAVQACDRKIETLDVERERLDELFKAMLEELMTARLSAAPLIQEHQPQ